VPIKQRPPHGGRCIQIPPSRLSEEKQVNVVAELTRIVAAAATDASVKERIWVLLTEAPDGGWGLAGRAHTNAELVAVAREQLGKR
jgi:phenylpyruvate tautomerase PptA (4-oxalocrotonate tautomerase family)